MKKTTTLKLPVIIAVLAIIFGCAKTKDGTLPDHSVFFPVRENTVQKFRVRSVTIDKPMDYYDTLEYYISVESDRVYADSNTLTGEYTVYTGGTISTATTPHSRMVRELTSPVGMYAENTDNCRKIKCRLPVIVGNEWNPNIYCISSDTTVNSVIRDIRERYTLNGVVFDSVIHIVNQYDSSLIKLEVRQEIWAAHHGLIYLELTSIESNDPDLNFTIPIRQRIVRGRVLEVWQVFE